MVWAGAWLGPTLPWGGGGGHLLWYGLELGSDPPSPGGGGGHLLWYGLELGSDPPGTGALRYRYRRAAVPAQARCGTGTGALRYRYRVRWHGSPRSQPAPSFGRRAGPRKILSRLTPGPLRPWGGLGAPPNSGRGGCGQRLQGPQTYFLNADI